MNTFTMLLNQALNQNPEITKAYDFHKSTAIISTGINPCPLMAIATYIADYLEELNNAKITNHFQLSITITTENETEGTHTWIFQPKQGIDYTELSTRTINMYLSELKAIFPIDPDVSLQEPNISYINGTFTVIIPWTC